MDSLEIAEMNHIFVQGGGNRTQYMTQAGKGTASWCLSSRHFNPHPLPFFTPTWASLSFIGLLLNLNCAPYKGNAHHTSQKEQALSTASLFVLYQTSSTVLHSVLIPAQAECYGVQRPGFWWQP